MTGGLVGPDYDKQIRDAIRKIRNLPVYSDTRDGTPHAEPAFINLLLKNDSGEAIPPWGCIKVSDVDTGINRIGLVGVKPTGADGVFVFNGVREIAIGGVGPVHAGPIVRCLFGDGTGANGATYGPVNASWKLEESTSGIATALGAVPAEADQMFARICCEGAETCDEIGLAPGVYRGIAGAAIAAGEAGPVAIDTDDGIVGTVYEAINQTECPVEMGDRISIEVSPDCQAFFTTCKCCDGTPSDCCDRSIAICICNVQKILAVNGGVGVWDVSTCCDCVGATLTITLSCLNDVITADWDYECGMVTDSGQIDLSPLCSADDVTMIEQIGIAGCNLCDQYSNTFITDCTGCTEPDPCTSCILFVDYTADKSGVPGTDEDIGVNTADLSVTRSVTCNGQRVTVNFTVTNNTGSLWESVPAPSEDAYLYFAWTDSTGSHANVTYIGATPAPVRGPGAGALIYDDQVDWDISIANGGTANFSITFELAASGTNGMAFEVAVVRGFRGTGQFDDEACP